ncbi:helix-turn-helix transcriptional regulator [Agromyces atrinae]|nr:helix-turn-helix transcriptional regulator [Agromyces atrinae]NYD67687.1 DNA-binding CsgD family transcriptional regulator [Agromyces atrinae]
MNLNDSRRASDELTRALGSGNAETIARAASTNIWPLYSDHTDMLTMAIAALPSPVLERHPMLRVLHPMTPVLARTSRPFKPVVYADDARSMSPEELDFVYLAHMIAFRLSGDTAASVSYARRLEDRLLQTRVESRDRMDGPLWFFHHQIGSTLLSAGDTSGALLEFATSRQLGKFSLQTDAERMALGRTALAHAVRGSLGEADRALADAQQLPEPTHGHLCAVTTSEAAAAGLLAVDRMTDDVDELLSAMEPYDSIEVSWPFALLARCRSFLAREQPEDALEAIHLAADAHIVQDGSFASDVIAAKSIQAFLATGDIAWAHRVAEDKGASGVLTRLAVVRLSLQDGRFDAAAHDLRLLAADHSLGPAQRSEVVLLAGWLEFGRTGEITRDMALQISRTARRDDSRRQFAALPKQLIEHASTLLSGESGVEFDALTAGLATFEIARRPTLTAGEQRILNALAVHSSTASMASAFHVSPNTVKSQLRTLYRKLGCSSRAEAVRIATRLHLLAGEVAT